MEKTNEQINYGKALETLKDEIIPVKYGLSRTKLGNMLVLTKNDVPVMPVPEHLKEDFVQLLSKAATYDKMMTEGFSQFFKDEEKEPPYKMPINSEVQADIETAIATGRFEEFYEKGEL